MNGEYIKTQRKELRLTQDELAKKLGVDRRTIINYEKGEIIPDSKVKLLDFILNQEKQIKANNDVVNTVAKPLPIYNKENLLKKKKYKIDDDLNYIEKETRDLIDFAKNSAILATKNNNEIVALLKEKIILLEETKAAQCKEISELKEEIKETQEELKHLRNELIEVLKNQNSSSNNNKTDQSKAS